MQYPIEIGPKPAQFGSWFTSMYSGGKGPPGQPPGTTWLTYGQIDAQVARQIKSKIEAGCMTAPIAEITLAAKASLTSLKAYLDVLQDPNAVTQVVADATQSLTAAGKLVPVAGCGPAPATGQTGATGATAALSNPNNLMLMGAAGLALMFLMRRR